MVIVDNNNNSNNNYVNIYKAHTVTIRTECRVAAAGSRWVGEGKGKGAYT